MKPTEPQIHSHYVDGLPAEHAWACKTVSCGRCGVMVHAFNNECMQDWVEWCGFALCLQHAMKAFSEGVCASIFALAAQKFPCTDGD